MPSLLAETPRLRLRELQLVDAPFVLSLLNEPAFHRHIGDKGVRDLAQAEAYLQDGPLASYRAHGFGLWCVERRDDGVAVGMAGLLRRDWLPAADIGYALLAGFAGRGYAREAAAAVCDLAARRFGLDRLLAIVNPDNAASIGLLVALGFHADGEVTPPGAAAPIRRYRRALAAGGAGDEAIAQAIDSSEASTDRCRTRALKNAQQVRFSTSC
jgi:[ribosomal protein S5]-alanine N-acetyltransferase